MIAKASSIPANQRLLRKRTAVALGRAGDIIALAEEDRETIHREAKQAGYEEGLAQWTAVVLEAQRASAARFDQAEPELVKLALGIARKVIAEEMRIAPEAVGAIVKGAIQNVRRAPSLHIQVHPDSLPYVEARMAEVQRAAGDNCRLVITASESVEPGGCLLSNEYGSVDARLETQITVLERILLK